MLRGNILAYMVNKPTWLLEINTINTEIVVRTMCGICIEIVWVKEKLTGKS